MSETQETWVGSLNWKDPLEEGKATHTYLAWRIPWTEEPSGLYSPLGGKESDTTGVTEHARIPVIALKILHSGIPLSP